MNERFIISREFKSDYNKLPEALLRSSFSAPAFSGLEIGFSRCPLAHQTPKNVTANKNRLLQQNRNKKPFVWQPHEKKTLPHQTIKRYSNKLHT